MAGEGHPFLMNMGFEIDIILLVGEDMKVKITLKRFKTKYIDDMIRLFRLSVQKTCIDDYSKEQIDTWILGVDKTKWIATFNAHYSLVALKGNTPIGFGDISEDGYLNMLYVHPKYQNKGVATLICNGLERHVEKDVTVNASITAKKFFMKRGYEVINEQTVYRKGIPLDNFKMKKHYVNHEIGKSYGYLTILEDTGKKYHSTKIYKCRCECGNIIEVNINKLHTGHVKSCGCRRFRWKNLTGQRFGRLEVLEFAYTKDNKNFWKCRCDCGNVCYVNTASLTNGTTVSCGCKNDENRASLSSFDRGLVDGTMKCAIKKDRKLNKNNSSGVRGVHYDKDRKLWVAQIMFQRKAHLLGRFKTKREAIRARQVGEEKYFGKYR